jgi:ATP-dependent Clp protease ATP-binding subunit ClpA
VRAQVVRIVGSGEEVTCGQIPFTPRAKHVLELALREALSLGHNDIGTEHILLGLAREQGVAHRILLDADADAEKIRNDTINLLAGPDAPAVDRQRDNATDAWYPPAVASPATRRDHGRRVVRRQQFGGFCGPRRCSGHREDVEPHRGLDGDECVRSSRCTSAGRVRNDVERR